MWEERMKMILNEYRLMPWQKEAQELVTKHMEDFFFGEGAALPPATSRSKQVPSRQENLRHVDLNRAAKCASRTPPRSRPRLVAAREDESQVAPPSGSGSSNWSGFAVMRTSRCRASRAAVESLHACRPRAGIGIIITPDAPVLARQVPSRPSPSRAAGSLLRAPRVSAAGASNRRTLGAEPADRSRRDFEHQTPSGDAALGVDRSVHAGRARASPRIVSWIARSVFRRRGRRRDVDRLFEERPFERIRLVEDREDVQTAIASGPLRSRIRGPG